MLPDEAVSEVEKTQLFEKWFGFKIAKHVQLVTYSA